MDFRQKLERVPWASRGRVTPISRLAQSVVPIGISDEVEKHDLEAYVELQDAEHERRMLKILGTAFQAAPGKLLTCWHVVEDLQPELKKAYSANPCQGKLNALDHAPKAFFGRDCSFGSTIAR